MPIWAFLRPFFCDLTLEIPAMKKYKGESELHDGIAGYQELYLIYTLGLLQLKSSDNIKP